LALTESPLPSTLKACAAEGPALASPDGEPAPEHAATESATESTATKNAASSAASSDPRVTLRNRLRGLDELAELTLPEPKKLPEPKAPAAPARVAPAPVVEAPVALPAGSEPQPIAPPKQPIAKPAPRPLAPPVAAARAPLSEPALEPLEITETAKLLVPPSEECPQTRLPWADRPIHSAAMDAVTRQANECTQRGYELAARGATYSARAELIRALRLIAQALDAQNETTVHSKARAAGLRALSEADDFVPRLSRVEAELNVPLLISSHQTPVLKGESTENITPLAARQRYYTFAQEQLGAAAGREPAGSLALYALGRIQPTLITGSDSDSKTADPKSVAFYRAALTVDGRNYLASNELGVLLARFGMWREARAAFVQSLSVAPQGVTWRNLAIVHAQLGEKQLAERAQLESQVVAARERTGRVNGSAPEVKWVDAETFAKSSSNAHVDVVQTPKETGKTLPTTRK
jgi:tetratricopeptide (TPR) repeat protein